MGKVKCTYRRGGVVTVIGAVVKGDSRVDKPKKLDAGRLLDKEESLNAPNRSTESS